MARAAQVVSDVASHIQDFTTDSNLLPRGESFSRLGNVIIPGDRRCSTQNSNRSGQWQNVPEPPRIVSHLGHGVDAWPYI